MDSYPSCLLGESFGLALEPFPCRTKRPVNPKPQPQRSTLGARTNKTAANMPAQLLESADKIRFNYRRHPSPRKKSSGGELAGPVYSRLSRPIFSRSYAAAAGPSVLLSFMG